MRTSVVNIDNWYYDNRSMQMVQNDKNKGYF